MRSVVKIAEENFGVSTFEEVEDIYFNFKEEYFPDERSWHISLPYISDDCPGPFSDEEIEEASKTQLQRPHLPGNTIFRVQNTVFKYGPTDWIIEEAENLLFLAANSQVRVPKVYEVTELIREDKPLWREALLITEYIEGSKMLCKDYIQIPREERKTLHARIAEQFRLLRSIPSEGYYGRVHRQPFGPDIHLVRTNGLRCCGPFDTYEEFASALMRSAEVCALMGCDESDEYIDERSNTILNEWKEVMENSKTKKPVFTHPNPIFGNIMIRRIPGTDDHPTDWEVTLIDWVGAGWMPGWVQGATFVGQFVSDATDNDYSEFNKEYVAEVWGSMECDEELVRYYCEKLEQEIRHSIR